MTKPKQNHLLDRCSTRPTISEIGVPAPFPQGRGVVHRRDATRPTRVDAWSNDFPVGNAILMDAVDTASRSCGSDRWLEGRMTQFEPRS